MLRTVQPRPHARGDRPPTTTLTSQLHVGKKSRLASSASMSHGVVGARLCAAVLPVDLCHVVDLFLLRLLGTKFNKRMTQP